MREYISSTEVASSWLCLLLSTGWTFSQTIDEDDVIALKDTKSGVKAFSIAAKTVDKAIKLDYIKLERITSRKLPKFFHYREEITTTFCLTKEGRDIARFYKK